MKISIVKDSVVLFQPEISKADIDLLTAVQPKSLKLMDEDKNVMFTVVRTDGEPSLSNFGLAFNPDKPIVVVYKRPVTEDMIKADYAGALLKVAAVEAQISTAVASLNANLATTEFEHI
jgi:hypothetical protein